MSTLHKRGYRPKPGERVIRGRLRHGAARPSIWWRWSWMDVRGRDGGSSKDALDSIGRACLDARLAPDPLRWAQAARIIKVSGLGRGDGDRMAPGLVVARRNARRADG